MKTPIQEVYENFNLMSDSDFKTWMLNTDLIKKEKQIIQDAFLDGYLHSPDEGFPEYAKNYYNEKFKTNTP